MAKVKLVLYGERSAGFAVDKVTAYFYPVISIAYTYDKRNTQCNAVKSGKHRRKAGGTQKLIQIGKYRQGDGG